MPICTEHARLWIPTCGYLVTPPYSVHENPIADQAMSASAPLSKPAANPSGWWNIFPKTSIGTSGGYIDVQHVLTRVVSPKPLITLIEIECAVSESISLSAGFPKTLQAIPIIYGMRTHSSIVMFQI